LALFWPTVNAPNADWTHEIFDGEECARLFGSPQRVRKYYLGLGTRASSSPTLEGPSNLLTP
jgi:hypothetical protein